MPVAQSVDPGDRDQGAALLGTKNTTLSTSSLTMLVRVRLERVEFHPFHLKETAS